MSCDIHDYAEVRRNGIWFCAKVDLIDYRSYRWFGFLADVRNASCSPVITQPRGIPDDATPIVRNGYSEQDDCLGVHTPSWLTLAELLAYDYDQEFEDRRTTKRTGVNTWDAGATADPGEGARVTLREFLGPDFFERLDELAALGDPQDVRLVFWFDN